MKALMFCYDIGSSGRRAGNGGEVKERGWRGWSQRGKKSLDESVVDE